MESEFMYQYKDYLEGNMKFTAYRETVVNAKSIVHKHDFLELVYIISGNATHYIDDTKYEVSKGDMLLIDTNQTHFYESENSITYANMILLPDFISENLHTDYTSIDLFAYYLYSSEIYYSGRALRAPLIRFRGNDLIAADAIVNAMCDEILNKENNYAEIVSSYLNILFYMMIRNIEKRNNDKVMHDIRNVIPGIIDFIESNCGTQITLNEIAKKYFYSPSYFSRAFKKHFGMSFSMYLQEVRIKKVIQLMQNSSLSIEDISDEIGYRDKRELYRAFKNVTGTTPGNYRKTQTS